MKNPKFSVVIAVGPDRKIEVLESLKKVRYPKNKYEIIVKRGLNPSENRNNAIKEAKGEIIAILDDDVYLDNDIFLNAESFFREHPEIDLVGGPQLTPTTDNFFAKASGYVLESSFGAYKMSSRYKKNRLNLDADETCLTSANCFVKREVFKKAGNFNISLYPGEDPEFFSRVKANKIRIGYSPDIIVYHRRRNSFFLFCRQIYKYGKVRMIKEKLNRTRVNPIFLIPSFFLIYLAALPFIYYMISKILILPLLVYLTANILFSFMISIRKDPYAFPLLIVLFFAIHLSYGIGILSYFYTMFFKRKKQI